MTSSRAITAGLFHDFFPPPDFLRMPAAGLNMSDGGLFAVRLARRHSGRALVDFRKRPLPPGVISGGYVNDKNRLLVELRALKEELSLDFVNASLSEEKAYLVTARIPSVPREEIKGVLEFKLEEYVPLKASDAIFDYAVVSPQGPRAADHLDLIVTALPKKVVETYSELIRSAGLTPLSFETEAQAVARAVVKTGDDRPCLIANFGETKTGLFIVSGGTVNFTSTIGIGGRNITEAIAKHLSVGTAEAEVVKRERVPSKNRNRTDLFLSLMNALSAFKDEVNKLLLYWSTHKGPGGEAGATIGKLILCGRDAALLGFDDYLSLSFNLPVEVANVWTNICSFEEYIPPLQFEESLDYAAAIGLALPGGE